MKSVKWIEIKGFTHVELVTLVTFHDFMQFHDVFMV